MTEKQYPELPEPFGWLSYNVLTRKTFFGNMPLQSLQPGVYQYIRAYTKSQVIEAIDADRAMRSQDAEDAARYRWLRDGNNVKQSPAVKIATSMYGYGWDVAIDAARAKEQV